MYRLYLYLLEYTFIINMEIQVLLNIIHIMYTS